MTPPSTVGEEKLAAIWQEVLGLSEVGIHDNFFELGGDSILSIQIIARARQAGMQLTPRQLFEHQSIAGLAAVAVTTSESGEVEGQTGLLRAPQEELTGRVELTPIQEWFFRLKLEAREHFNQSLMVACPEEFEAGLLPTIITELLAHHDALRGRFECVGGRWQQRLVSMEEAGVEECLVVVDLSGEREEEIGGRISEEAERWQRSLDLGRGPMCRFVYYERGGGRRGRLLIIIHHLVVDGVSWRILLEDLWQLYRQMRGGERLGLGAKTNSVQQWGEYLRRVGNSGVLQGEVEYWREQSVGESRGLVVDDDAGSNLQREAEVVQRGLSRERTRELVQEVPGVYGTQIQEVLLTALVMAWGRWSGRATVKVEVEGHGREWLAEGPPGARAATSGAGEMAGEIAGEIDVTRTIGWFTTIYPVRLKVKEGSDAGGAIKQVKEQLRRVPGRGLGYGVLKYLSEDEELREELEKNEGAGVLFNYLGQFEVRGGESRRRRQDRRERGEGNSEEEREAGFEVTGESSGAGRDEGGERHHELVINAVIAGGRLQLEWEYSARRLRKARVEEMARDYEQELLKLIDHCVREDAGGYTPSDFFLGDLPQEELDRAVMEVDFESR
jgi:microcystin synthetase protein McyA